MQAISLVFLLFSLTSSQAVEECYDCMSPALQDYWYAAGLSKQPDASLFSSTCESPEKETTNASTCTGNCFAYTVYLSPTTYGVVRGCTTDYPKLRFPAAPVYNYASVPNTNFYVLLIVCAPEHCNENPSKESITSHAIPTGTTNQYTEYPSKDVKCESSYGINGHHISAGTCTGDACSLTTGYRTSNGSYEFYYAQGCVQFNLFGSTNFQYDYIAYDVSTGVTIPYYVQANTSVCTTENCNYYNTATSASVFMAMALTWVMFLFL